MHNTTAAIADHQPEDTLHLPAGRGIAAARLAIGVLQGLVLFWLYQSVSAASWPSQTPLVLRPLLLLALLLPPVAITGLGHLRAARLGCWLSLLAALLVAIGCYDAWRADLGGLLDGDALRAWRAQQHTHWLPSYLALTLSAAGLFIGQAMALAANADARLIAHYRSYFALAWKLALQLALALLFILMLWLVLYTGAALFGLLQIDFLRRLLGKPWFNLPVCALAAAGALHLTDVRPAIIAGVRRLLLTVLSWLLPLCTVMVAGFLASLLVTGLQPLWQTRHAAQVLLGTCALLVTLINVLYQDGSTPHAHRVVGALLRLSCLLPLPLVGLAMYALALRVAQYGWTVDRITAALAMLLAAIYALGYALAAARRQPGMPLLARTNILASLALLAMCIAVLTPVADPARIAVADQLSRLLSGHSAARRLDAQFWRFDSARHGVQALHTLEQAPQEPDAWLREAAQQALRRTQKWNDDQHSMTATDVAANLRLRAGQDSLPAGFVATDWKAQHPTGLLPLPACLREYGAVCDLYVVHLPQQQQPHVLLFDASDTPPSLFSRERDGWRMVGNFDVTPACRTLLKRAADSGQLMWQPVPSHDLLLGDSRLALTLPRSLPVDCAQRTR